MARGRARTVAAVLAAAAAAAAVGARPAGAAVDAWTGLTNANWDTNTNWALASKPTAADDADFPAVVPVLSGPVITLGTGEVANAVLFHNAYTFNGGDLTLSTGTAPAGQAAAGSVTVDPTFTAAINSALLTNAVTKLGGGTLDLSSNAATNTYATLQVGTANAAAGTYGTVVFNSAGQLGTDTTTNGAVKLFDGGNLQLKPGSGAATIASRLNSGGSYFESAASAGVGVGAGDTLTLTGHFLTGTTRGAFRAFGGGTLRYTPGTAPTSPETWSVRADNGTTIVLDQLPYRNNQSTGAATGRIEFGLSGGSSATVRILANANIATTAANGTVTPAAGVTTNFTVGYGPQQLPDIQYTGGTGLAVANLNVDAGAVFQGDKRPDSGLVLVPANTQLNLNGADDTSIIRFGQSSSGGAISATGNTGTINLTGGTLYSTGRIGDVFPNQPEFTLKLNGGVFNGDSLNGAAQQGSLVANDAPTGGAAGNPRIDNYAFAGTGNTTWGNGTLEKVNVTTTGTGQTGTGHDLNISRTGGTVTVAAGATLKVTAGTVTVGGTVDPFTDSADATKHVAVVNNSTGSGAAGSAGFNVTTGSVGVAALSGTGTTNVTVAAAATAGTTLTANSVQQAALNITSQTAPGTQVAQVTIRPAAQGGGTSKVNSLVISGTTGAWTGRLDLTDNRAIIDYTGTSPLATVADQVKSGYNNGGATAWQGNGITSSKADAAKFAVGYAEASDVLSPTGGTFGGVAADGTSVLVRYTLSGDANLDGVVNIADFARLQNNFNQPATAGWPVGDFNYDGVVNIADFAMLQNNFNQTAPNGLNLTAGATPQDYAALSAFAQEIGASSVPEPGSLGLAALAAAGLLGRRAGRRRRPARA